MTRIFLVCLGSGAVLALTAGALLVVTGARPVSACDRSLISGRLIPSTVAESQVVAVGEFVAAAKRSATFRVDESLRGPAVGATLNVDNRTAYTDAACSPYDEPFREGFRFKKGDRKVLILEKEVDGLWQVGFYSDAAWDVPADDLQPLVMDFWVDQVMPPRLDTVRKEIVALRDSAGSDLAFEERTPCNVVPDRGPRVASSTAVVIADIEPGAEFVTATIIDVLAGAVDGATVTINHRTRRDWDDCDVVLEPAYLHPEFAGRHLLYLRPDEFGVADYRPTLWGFAHEQVNEEWVTNGLPTLRDIRMAVSLQSPQMFVPEDDGGSAWARFVVIGGAIALAVAAMVMWRRLAPFRQPPR